MKRIYMRNSVLMLICMLHGLIQAQTVVKMKMASQAQERVKVVALFDEEIPESIPVVLGVMGYGITGGTAPYRYEWLQNGKVIGNSDVAVVTPARGDVLELKVTDSGGCSSTTSFNLKVIAKQNFLPDGDDGTINIFPTIVDGSINVEFTCEDRAALVRIFNLNGETLLRRSIAGNSQIAADLPSGIYFVSVQTSDRHVVRKIIKR